MVPKGPEREAPTDAKVNVAWSCTSPSSIYLHGVVLRHSSNFAFTLPRLNNKFLLQADIHNNERWICVSNYSCCAVAVYIRTVISDANYFRSKAISEKPYNSVTWADSSQ